MIKKNAYQAGADARTPSIPQYFSWINNTNEGSTEEHTLINLDFFAWLKREYGMQIKIYALDGGNFDGVWNTYADLESPKFKANYPNSFDRIYNRATELGIRLGLWEGPDGFGDTPEEERRRHETLVDFCRKYHLGLFKIDTACGHLRPEKVQAYIDMIQDCRKYSPDLVVLNHRVNMYEAEPYVTTVLWQGAETYVDVLFANSETCMHHRGFIFKRGIPDGLGHLMEDHGVCISSAVAYFEDDLIYQAFGRSFIVSPEVYGNPWLMRDDEFPKLARVYNLHRACAPLLVDGMVLPEAYGDTPISRGSGAHRFITTGNHGWTTRKISIKLDAEIGLRSTRKKVALVQRHPTEKLIGFYNFGDTVDVELMPFRAHLFEIAPQNELLPVLENCEYETVREDENGYPLKVKMLCCDECDVTLIYKGERRPYGHYEKTDIREFAPLFLGKLTPTQIPEGRSEELYENTQFGIDNDSLESRELRRAGKTAIPEVQAARDAFFNQRTYTLRGCESFAMFDGDPDTFFDSASCHLVHFFDNVGMREGGGCLRVDFGDVFDADEVEITCFSVHEPFHEIREQRLTDVGSYSSDLIDWKQTEKKNITVIDNNREIDVVKMGPHNIISVTGDMLRVSYKLSGAPVRYFRLSEPMDRIYSVRLLKNGQEISLKNPKANNLQAPYEKKIPVAMQAASVTLPESVKDDDYIAVALNGVHGREGAYCIAELDGKLLTFPDRAPSYLSNVWEFCVCHSESNYTYYMPLTADMAGKNLTVRALLCDSEHTDLSCDVWLCPKH